METGKPNKLTINGFDRECAVVNHGEMNWDGTQWNITSENRSIVDSLTSIFKDGLAYGDKILKMTDQDFYLPLTEARYTGIAFAPVK